MIVNIRGVQFFDKFIDPVSNILFVPYPIRRVHRLTINEWAFIGRASYSLLSLPGNNVKLATQKAALGTFT